MTRRPNLNQGFLIRWSRNFLVNESKSIYGQTEITINEDHPAMSWHVKLQTVENISIKNSMDLSRRYSISLKEGVQVNDNDWELIKKTADITLVPSSQVSRGGAGAEIDDNL